MYPKVSIATTLINAEDILVFFIKYHLAIGFEHIFLFFDNPNDKSIRKAEKFEKVTVIRNDDSLKNLWKMSPQYELMYYFRDQEVEARQVLNTDVALHLAMEMKLDWLLHIDIDELFYSPKQSVKEHFQDLIEKGVKSISYFNYEAVPEKFEINNFFRHITLFKKNFYLLSPEEKEKSESLTKNKANFFFQYANGKSAARVIKGLRASGTHFFYTDSMKAENFPLILHYPCCGFKHFLKKYQTLGNFSGQHFNTNYSTLLVHLKSRDVVMSGDLREIRDFYEKEIMIFTPEQIELLIKENLFCHITEPSRMEL